VSHPGAHPSVPPPPLDHRCGCPVPPRSLGTPLPNANGLRGSRSVHAPRSSPAQHAAAWGAPTTHRTVLPGGVTGDGHGAHPSTASPVRLDVPW
jgi:hypothetical protein